jgi:glycosyltransferase involved in cell wall biosynthesis
VKKILFIPPGIQNGWYMENHYEYIIRGLSDEFFIEQATTPYEPYDNFIDRYPSTSPLDRNPNDYDLLVPILPSHAGVNILEYKHKTAIVMYEPGEGHSAVAKTLAGATPYADQANYEGRKCYPVRFGVDTEIFKPYPMLREDDLLHVGIVGSLGTPRRMIEQVIKPLFDLEGVRIMLFPSPWINNGGEPEVIEKLGGMEFIKRCVSGNKRGVGVANMYNQLDVLIRCDASYGYSFPVMEAAACGVPVIATDCGIDHFITEAGGGILIEGNPLNYINNHEELRDKVREAVIWMRDHPRKRKAMGKAGREEILKNWRWYKHLPAWRKFLRAATA